MNYLFICNSLFQILSSLIIMENYNIANNKNTVDIILTKRIPDVDAIADRMKICLPIRNVDVVDTFCSIAHRKLFYYHKAFCEIKGCKVANTLYASGCASGGYDVMFVYSCDCFAENVFDYVYRRNNEIKVFLYDEGLGTYMQRFQDESTGNGFLKTLARRLAEKFGKQKAVLSQHLSKLFLYQPCLIDYDWDIKKEKIEYPSTNTDFINLVNEIFDFKVRYEGITEKKDKITYIYFEQPMLNNKLDMIDNFIFERFIHLLKNDTLVIKRHPRSQKDYSSKFRTKNVIGNNIPWELFLLNHSVERCVFITYISSAAFNSVYLLGEKAKVIFLYNLIRKDQKETNTMQGVDRIVNKLKEKIKAQIFVPCNIEELQEAINTLSCLR